MTEPTEATDPRRRSPVMFSEEIFDAICERIAQGESLREICAAEDMPHRRTVLRWMRNDPSLSHQYAHAREEQADLIVDEILAIADDARGDWSDGENGPRFNAENVQRSRLRIEARKWQASKLAPKVYGDRQFLDMSVKVEDLSDEELDRQIAQLQAELGLA